MGKPKNKNASFSEEDFNLEDELDANLDAEDFDQVKLDKIETQEDAVAFLKENYVIPEGALVAYVSEDKNVFWKEGHSSAVNYVQEKKIKLFTIDISEL